MIKPMLAAPLRKGVIHDWTAWVAEVKYDGHRVVIEVIASDVRAYTRPRGADKAMAQRALPPHLVKALGRLPVGVYDGELLAGDTATDVTRTDLEDERRVVLFDMLIANAGRSVQSYSYDERRALLKEAVTRTRSTDVTVSTQWSLTSQDDVTRLAKTIWKTGGEGLILKRRLSIYQAGKRSTDWLKIKREEHHTLTVIGWEVTRGELLKRGPFAIVRLRDDEGRETTCKTKDNVELAAFEAGGFRRAVDGTHPALGRKLVIECGGRTRDGGYKGPVIWDRWEDE